MVSQKVISREYKLALKAKNFTGDEAALIEKANLFFTELGESISSITAIIEGNTNVKSIREIKFFDTQKFFLQQSNYIFRERTDLSNNQKQVTLKFRHPDRYIAQDRDMNAQDIAEAELKFEEDIKAPFQVLYSFSSTCAIDENTQLKKLKHIVKLFGGLAEKSKASMLEEKIVQVNDFVVREMVITGPQLILSDEPSKKAECALIMWYNMEKNEKKPVIAEFSFRYKDKKGEYSADISQKAHDIFLLIQQEMQLWIDKNNATKTGLIFEKIR